MVRAVAVLLALVVLVFAQEPDEGPGLGFEDPSPHDPHDEGEEPPPMEEMDEEPPPMDDPDEEPPEDEGEPPMSAHMEMETGDDGPSDEDEPGDGQGDYDPPMESEDPPPEDGMYDEPSDDQFPEHLDEDEDEDEEDLKAEPEVEEEDDMLSVERLHALFKKFDADKDGVVTKDELMQFAKKIRRSIAREESKDLFEALDMDRDGRVSLDEHLFDYVDEADADFDQHVKSARQQRKASDTEKFKACDKDNDSTLDRSEGTALFHPEVNPRVMWVTVKAIMQMRDKNDDKQLSPHELWDYDESEHLPDEELADFARLDKDTSGYLNLEELYAWESGVFRTEQAMKELVMLADRNGDGAVAPEEIQKVRQYIPDTDASWRLKQWADHMEL